VGRFWVDQRIRDQGNPPVTVKSPQLLVRAVASLAGAVSYSTESLLTPKVKVLEVDGKHAGEPGYALARADGP
jgi:hypothetical protein